MLISETKFWGVHVMKVHLHGLVSRLFQSEKEERKEEGGGDGELWSHE